MAECKACQLFWNSRRCLKSKGLFWEAHLHLSYAICGKACGVFVCWFDRWTCNGQGRGAAAPNKVILRAGVLSKSTGLNCHWFFSAHQRQCVFLSSFGFLFAFTIFFCCSYIVLNSKLRWNRDVRRLLVSTKSFPNQPGLKIYLEMVREIYGIWVTIGIS